MGASRDFTAGARSGTATLERPAARRTRRDTARAGSTQLLERRYEPHALHPRHTQGAGRLGSRQVVSVRGRRVGANAQNNEVKRRFSTVTVIVVPLLICGVLVAMFLSGISTSQSFTIQQLQARERDLTNEVETLNRDAENAKSSSEIARRAADAGMVVSNAPGILTVTPEGHVEENRPFDPEATQPLSDAVKAGAAPGREDRATSDRNATAEVGDRLTQVPGGSVLGRDNAPAPAPGAQGTPAAPPAPVEQNLAPYAPRVQSGN